MSTLKLNNLTVEQAADVLSALPNVRISPSRLVDIMWEAQFCRFRDVVSWWYEENHTVHCTFADCPAPAVHAETLCKVTAEDWNRLLFQNQGGAAVRVTTYRSDDGLNALYRVEVELPHVDDCLIARLIEAAAARHDEREARGGKS